MKKILFIFFFVPLLSIGQQGIKFQHSLSWKQIIQKAKTENKYIFVDAFATWCGPCKYMAAKIFPQEQVGELFNSHFINVKVQMDTSAKDNADVKKWYADASAISKDYKVKAYPTFLFFSPGGKLVHRVVGSMEADELNTKAKNALDESTQYYSMLSQYRNGKKEADFLKKLAYAADDAYESENMTLVSNDYLATQKEFLTDENMDFIFHFTQSSKDVGFAVLLANETKLNEVKKNTAATDLILEIIKKDEIYPSFKTKNTTGANWTALYLSISKKYPKHADEAIAGGKVAYYQKNHDWEHFQTAVRDYMNKYGEKATAVQLNDFAWTVFENCKDMTCVQDALEWSKRSISEKEESAYIDTYANLLYRMGRKDEAISWEQKGLSMVGEEEKGDFVATIEKMKKGEKTWKE